MEPLFIGPYDLGVQRNLKPFMLPEKAFPDLENAFIFRGRIEKKMGFASQGRLRRFLSAVSMGNISAGGAGTFTFNIFIQLGIGGEPNAQIDPGTAAIPLVINIAAPIGQTLTDNTGTGTMTIAPAGVITAATLNYATGILSLTFSGAAGVSAATFTGAYFPGLPVMGLRLRELTTTNFEQTIGFDTKYVYRFIGGNWEELPAVTPTTWNGTDSDFFWTTNFSRDVSGNDLFWVTNFNTSTPDPIRYYDGSDWITFNPQLNVAGDRKLITAQILLPYKDRLIALNTYEQTAAGPTTAFFPQRARYSQIGNPTDQVNGWLDTVLGRGGFIDAPTSEKIISAGFIKDTLVVYFERSTWQLAYYGNQVIPFVWQRINSELGAESTFSNVVFDNGLIAFGNVGLHVSNGVSCERIDASIPDEVFTIQNKNQGPKRVYAIRDFINELVYFTYPDETKANGTDLIYPNKVLVYNYRNDTYSFFIERFTCYGYFQRTTGLTWSELVAGSGYAPWQVWNDPWNSGLSQSEIPDIVAGNQQGFVVRLIDIANNSNAPTLSITAMTGNTITSINHNLNVGEYVQVLNALGATNFNNTIFRIETVVDKDNFTVNGIVVGTYIGNGVLKVLSNINILTKMFTPFWKEGKNYRLLKIEYLFDQTFEGEVSANVFVDMGDNYSVTDITTNPSVLGTNKISTFADSNLYGPGQIDQEQIWHRMYYYTQGETFQIQIILSDDQMRDINIVESDIVLHGMIMHFDSAGDFN